MPRHGGIKTTTPLLRPGWLNSEVAEEWMEYDDIFTDFNARNIICVRSHVQDSSKSNPERNPIEQRLWRRE